MKAVDAAAQLAASSDHRPPRVVTLPPSAFCEAWSKRPRGPFQVGLRRLSADEYLYAKAEAEKLTAQLVPDLDRREPDWLEVYEVIYFHQILACALTDTLDARKPLWDATRGSQDATAWVTRAHRAESAGDVMIATRNPSEVVIATRFTAEGLARLHDEFTALRVKDSPLWPLAEDDDIAELGAELADGTLLAGLEAPTAPGESAADIAYRHNIAAEIRRHLGFVIGMTNRGLARPEPPTNATATT